MRIVTLWEGPRLRRESKKTFVGGNSRRSRKRRKKVTFVGELLGSWCDGHPFAHLRGAEYSVYRTETGEIVIHRVRWSGWTTADDEGKIFLFPNLEAAAVRFDDVLKNAGVLH